MLALTLDLRGSGITTHKNSDCSGLVNYRGSGQRWISHDANKAELPGLPMYGPFPGPGRGPSAVLTRAYILNVPFFSG